MDPSGAPDLITEIEDVRDALLAWGKGHYRDFPWRKISNPYHILIAEVLLHRTRADQVRPVFERFIRDYPDIQSLLDADPTNVGEHLRPLGLRWRTDLLQKMVQEIAAHYAGKIPLNRKELMTLPGVGDYISSALLTFSGTSPEPIMDTNTVRVIGRVFGLHLNDSARRKKQFRKIMQQLIGENRAIDVSFAMIDLAAQVCRPHTPTCKSCPISSFCIFAQTLTEIKPKG